MRSHAAVPHLLADADGRQVRESTDLLQSFGDKSLKIGAKSLRPVRAPDAKAFQSLRTATREGDDRAPAGTA
jgi:hypothetical protein